MIKCLPAIVLTFASLISAAANAMEPLDQRIVGTWEGMREHSGKCEFLAWNSTFTPDGRFKISFFADKKKTGAVQVEQGTWRTNGGKKELLTDGVPTAEVYLYNVINENTINYVNAVRDPSANYQADYEFTAHRVATSAASSNEPTDQYQFSASDRVKFDTKFEKFYLIAPVGSDSSTRQQAKASCEDNAKKYVSANSEGYKVSKSFGTSDEELIAGGTLSCLDKAGWKIHELRDGNITQVNDDEIFRLFFGGRK